MSSWPVGEARGGHVRNRIEPATNQGIPSALTTADQGRKVTINYKGKSEKNPFYTQIFERFGLHVTLRNKGVATSAFLQQPY